MASYTLVFYLPDLSTKSQAYNGSSVSISWLAWVGVDFTGITRNSGTKPEASIKFICFTGLQNLLMIVLTQPNSDIRFLVWALPSPSPNQARNILHWKLFQSASRQKPVHWPMQNIYKVWTDSHCSMTWYLCDPEKVTNFPQILVSSSISLDNI